MLAALALVLALTPAAEPSPASSAFVLDVEPNHSTIRRGYGIGTDWRHTVIPNFLGDDVSMEIDLWRKAGRPLPPAQEDKR